MKPQAKKKSNGVKSGERAAHGCVPTQPIQRPGKRQVKLLHNGTVLHSLLKKKKKVRGIVQACQDTQVL